MHLHVYVYIEYIPIRPIMIDPALLINYTIEYNRIFSTCTFTVTHMNIQKELKRSVLPSPNRSRHLIVPGSNQLVEPLDAPGPGHARYQAPQRCTMICRERLTIHLKRKNNITSWVLNGDVFQKTFENSTGRWLEAWETSLKILKTILRSHVLRQANICSTSTLRFYL